MSEPIAPGRDGADSVAAGRDGADIVYVLCLLQTAFVFLGGAGEMLLMGGNPAYAVAPIVKMVLLLVLATKVVSGRPWALITLIVVQGMTLVAFWIQVAAGFLPWIDFTVNLVGLLTSVAVPAAVIALCARLLGKRSASRVAAQLMAVPELVAGPEVLA